MADTALTSLTATTTLASTDLVYVVDGGNSRKATLETLFGYLNAYADAANTLALRNSTNAQTLKVFNTYTDASNNEFAYTPQWTGNVAYFGTGKAGTGTARDAAFYAPSGAGLQFHANGTRSWNINTSGHILAQTDNSYDIGASGATRPRTGYFATSVISPIFQSQAGGYIGLASGASAGAYLFASADGVMRITDYAATDFGRLQFGGTTTSFPALKRSSATLQARLADDSGFARFDASILAAAGAAGEAATIESATELLSGMSGASVSTTNLVPAGATQLGVVCRVTTLVTSGDGGTDFNVGDGSDHNRFGDSIAFAAGTTVDESDYTADPEGFSTGTQDVTLTCAASGVEGGQTFSAGAVRVTAFFRRFTPPTS